MVASRGGFSFASVVLGYLMIAGGIAAAVLVASELGLSTSTSEAALAAVFGGGALAGGFFAARASAGSTIAEPAIGAVLLVGTLGALFLATPVGRMLYAFAEAELTRAALVSGGAALAGSLVGAFVSERLLGESTTWSLPWILYVALAVGGGCFLASIGVGAVRLGEVEPSTLGGQLERDGALQVVILAGIGAGCLLAGLAAGASARRRVLAAAFLGAIAGVFGFFVLAGRFSRAEVDQDSLIGAGVIAVGGGIITLLAAALGWTIIGRRHAG